MSQKEVKKTIAITTTTTPSFTTTPIIFPSSPRKILLKDKDNANVKSEKVHNNDEVSLNIKNISDGDVQLYQQICDKIRCELNLLVSDPTKQEMDQKKQRCHSDNSIINSDIKDQEDNEIKREESENDGVHLEKVESQLCSSSMEVDDMKNVPVTSSPGACQDRKEEIKEMSSPTALHTTHCKEEERDNYKNKNQFHEIYINYIIQAGLNTKDSTVESIIKANGSITTEEEQQISLLLFETAMSKHEKISLAFQILTISRCDDQQVEEKQSEEGKDDSPNSCKRQKCSHEEIFTSLPTASTSMEKDLEDVQDSGEERQNQKRGQNINNDIALNEVGIRTLFKCILMSLTSVVKQPNTNTVNDIVFQKVTQLIQSLISFNRDMMILEKNSSNEQEEFVISLDMFRKWYEVDHDACSIINLLEYNIWKLCEEHPEVVMEQESSQKAIASTATQQNDRTPQEDSPIKTDLQPEVQHDQPFQHGRIKEEVEDMLVVLSPTSPSFPPIVNTVTDETNLSNTNNGNSTGQKRTTQLQISPQLPDPYTNPQSNKTTSTSPSSNPQASTTQSKKITVSSSSPSSRAVVSFDITSNKSSQNTNKSSASPPFNILITEENLQQLEKFVEYSNLINKPPTFITDKLFQYSTYNKESGSCGEEMIKLEAEHYSSFIDDIFSSCTDNCTQFKDFFRVLLECFDYHSVGYVNCIEVGIGFSFLCSGNKSSKLAMAYELLDTFKIGYLTSKALHVYFRSFLNMLVGISLLTQPVPEDKISNSSNKKIVYQALNYGATWTQDHLLSSLKKQPQYQQENDFKIKFEDFAEWYTEGGYTVAPWLELLDLGKFLSLLHSNSSNSSSYGKEDEQERRQQQHVPNDKYSPGANHESTVNNNRYRSDDNVFHATASHPSKGGNVKPSSNNIYPYPQQQQQQPPPHHHQPPASQQPSSSFFPPSPTNTAHSSIQSRNYNTYHQHQPHSYPPLPPAPLPPPASHGPRPHHPSSANHPQHQDTEVLFTFPLANDQSLIVQKEDALYVKTVVTQLGLLVLEPEEVWNILYHQFSATAAPSSHSHHFKCMKIDQRQFVLAMEMVLVRCYQINPSLKSSSKRIDPDSIFTLTNFYQSYDLEQMNSVPLNQLMGGLTLLCGGRKSVKLNFAFCLFSSSTTTVEKILNGDELYYFLRSYLIILFSCCAQSLHLSADCVSKYIQDTSYKVCDDVMRHQWHHKRIRFVTFDDFGDWYNEGGYDVAPWLELLDLKKWVFMDEEQSQPPGVSISSSGSSSSRDHHHHHQSSYYPSARSSVAPPPVDGKIPHHTQPQPSIPQSHSMTMDDDIMNYNSTVTANSNYSHRSSRYGQQQPPSQPPAIAAASSYDNNIIDDCNQPHDYYNYNHSLPHHHQQHHPEDDRNHSHMESLSRRPSSNRYHSSGTTPPPHHQSSSSSYHHHHHTQAEVNTKQPPSSSQLSFQLHTNDDFLGYLITISQQRVSFLKMLILSSGLSNLDVNFVCNRILEYASTNGKENDTNTLNINATSSKHKQMLFLSKDRFDMVMKSLLTMAKQESTNMTLDDQRNLSDLLTSIFYAFDRNKSKVVDALELTCGLSILCGGRKSDKLEYAFDLLSEHQEHPTPTSATTTGNHNCLSRRNMFRYLRSFLTVLMSITLNSSKNSSILETCSETISALKPTKKKVSLDQVIDSGSAWATDQVFINSNTTKVSSSSRQNAGNTIINFDDFADWYTRGGYSHIPWLELLDLRKWMFT